MLLLFLKISFDNYHPNELSYMDGNYQNYIKSLLLSND